MRSKGSGLGDDGVSVAQRVRVLAADSRPLYREAIKRAIKRRPELELVGEARDGREALARIATERPDVAVIERELAGLTADQILNAVDRDGLTTRVILLDAAPDSCAVYAALAGGAAGYLTTGADEGELCDAITAVARGVIVLASEVHTGIAAEIRQRAPHDRPFLSQRESEILKLVAQGLSAPQIGRALYVSSATVKTHLRHIYEKLGVAERAAAVAEGMRRGLLE